MTDIASQINDTRREIGSRHVAGKHVRSVVLRRRYDAPIEDVWDACTNSDRLNRWFLQKSMSSSSSPSDCGRASSRRMQGESVCKPASVPRRSGAAAIHLGPALPPASCGPPGGSTGQASSGRLRDRYAPYLALLRVGFA